MSRSTATFAAVLVILPALVAGGLFAVEPPTPGELAIIDAITAQTAADAAFYSQAIFLLQATAIPLGMILGVLIFSTWLRGRQSRLP